MLRLQIEGRWEPQDFIVALGSIESFYYKLVASGDEDLEHYPYWLDEYDFDRRYDLPWTVRLDRVNQQILERQRYSARSELRLKVAKIHYASPGSIDLLGVGKIFEVATNAIGRMKTHHDDAHLRKQRDEQAALDTALKRIEVEKEKENLQSLKIKNAREALELIEAHPSARKSLLPLLVRDQDKIAELIAEQKLIGSSVESDE